LQKEENEERKPRALLPFEVASIPFDIRFLFFFSRCIHWRLFALLHASILSV
jgi:hypothetical protein